MNRNFRLFRKSFRINFAPVAQLDRAPDFESQGTKRGRNVVGNQVWMMTPSRVLFLQGLW